MKNWWKYEIVELKITIITYGLLCVLLGLVI